MKQEKATTKKSFIKHLFFVMAVLFAGILQAQNSKEAAVQNLLDSRHFVFKAQYVSPQRGSTRVLTSDYDLKVSGDSLVSYLPYFGRAYTAPIGTSDGPLQFTSTQFTYDVKKKKKGWEMTILPKDASEVRQLFLSVFSNGSARLQVLSNNREGISFNGNIQPIK